MSPDDLTDDDVARILATTPRPDPPRPGDVATRFVSVVPTDEHSLRRERVPGRAMRRRDLGDRRMLHVDDSSRAR